MTKRNFIDLIRHGLAGGDMVADLEGRYHEAIVEKYVELAISAVLKNVQDNAIKYKDFGQLDDYTTTFVGVAVSYDSDRDEYYSLLPAKVVKLYMNRGIRFISPNKDQSSKFLYRDNNSDDVFTELEIDSIDGTIRWYAEAQSVYYKFMTTEVAASGVLMKLIQPISALADTDELNIPAGKEDYVIDFVRKYVAKMPPEDVINDNNSKQI